MRVFVVTLLGALVALLGVREATVERGAVDVLFSLAVGLAFTMSCFADARSMGKPLPLGAGLPILVLWPIAVPIYFLLSRGFRRGGVLAVGILAGELGLYLSAYYIARYAVWGEAGL